MTQAIDMLGLLARPARIGAYWRINDEHTDISVRQLPPVEVPPREIHNPDVVRLADWAQGAVPNSHPSGVRDQPELRAFRPQTPILFVDR